MTSPSTPPTAWPPLARGPEEWAEAARAAGGRAFHGKQIFRWIHARGVTEAERMTDLPGGLRASLQKEPLSAGVEIVTERRAADGTRKLLVKLKDGASVETVLIPNVTRGKSDLPSPRPARRGGRRCGRHRRRRGGRPPGRRAGPRHPVHLDAGGVRHGVRLLRERGRGAQAPHGS
jgi:hypothetical protein